MKGTKYNVNKNTVNRTFNDIVFDSAMEMKYYKEVILPQKKSGEISYFELQKKYELQPKFVHNGENVQSICYVADFFVIYANGESEVIDVKGFPDSLALIKRKLFWYKYPNLKYRWVCWSKIDGGWNDYELVKRKRLERKKAKSKDNEGDKKDD